MRIISKFRDYYDCIQRMGQDQNLIYLRKLDEIELKSYNFPMLEVNNTYPSDYQLRILGVCGKLYPLLEVYHSVDNIEYIYDIEEIHKYGNTIDLYYDTKHYGFSKKNIEEVFSFTYINTYFVDYKVPVFAIDSSFRIVTLTLNPNLSDYNFQKILDPYTIYQEIAMYISGVLGVGAPKMIEIADKDMLFKKGFNGMSFKTYSPGKKRKKK